MSKGGNVVLSSPGEASDPITLILSWTDPTGAGEADVSVLLLGADGKVRSDDDFFFYNHPINDDGSVQLLGKLPTDSGSADRISLDLAALPESVHGVTVAASRYDGATFGELDDLRLTLSDSGGDAVLAFDIVDASMETAFLFGELYRRGGGWKFRAVGQGYESGLAGLATDFGISIQDDRDDGTHSAEAKPVSASVDLVEFGPTSLVSQTEVRTARRETKKCVLPRKGKIDLADHASWRAAHLFSVSGLRNDQEREVRATSTLLAVLAEVPEFGRRITAKFGAPAGLIQTFTEASFKHGDSVVRPDGILRVSRAGRIWTALVETKIGGTSLRTDQVESYLEVAARNGFETVITLSNDLAITGEHPVSVDKRRTKKVALRHISWAEVTHEVRMLCYHDGVASVVHARLLGELLHYLEHDNAGCQGFQNMGAAWVPVRNSIMEGTLRSGDKRTVQVAESWEKLVRQLCLRLGGETGKAVAPVVRKRGTNLKSQRDKTVATLVDAGRMTAEIQVPGTAGSVSIAADLRTGQVETATVIPAPERVRSLTRISSLLRLLADAPAELRVEALGHGAMSGPCELLRNLRSEPGLLLLGSQEIASFRLVLPTSLGAKRGVEEAGFVRSVDSAVDRFIHEVLHSLKPAVGANRV